MSQIFFFFSPDKRMGKVQDANPELIEGNPAPSTPIKPIRA